MEFAVGLVGGVAGIACALLWIRDTLVKCFSQHIEAMSSIDQRLVQLEAAIRDLNEK